MKRAMEVKRGGKHLGYFRENRVIHDYLVKTAREHDVPVINNEDMKCTIKRMLSFARGRTVLRSPSSIPLIVSGMSSI